MYNAYIEFWRKNTSKVFEITVLWGLLLMAPAMFIFLASLAGISVGELLDNVLEQDVAYKTILFAYQIGMAGSILLWLPALLRLFATSLAHAFSAGVFSFFTLIVVGEISMLWCFYRLEALGAGSNDTPVAVAVIVTGVVLMATVILVDRKTRRKIEV